MTALADLEPQFLRYEERDGKTFFPYAETIADAHGVEFLCPKCFAKNGGPVGTHAVICWFRGRVPDGAEPGPGRWDVSGVSYSDLTLNPSVHLSGAGCGWHGWIKNGRAIV